MPETALEDLYPELSDVVARWAKRQVLPKDVFDQLTDEMKARAFTAAYLWHQAARVDAMTSLRDALLAGEDVKTWSATRWEKLAKKYGKAGAGTSWYTDTVFRTNTQAAYAGGRYAQMFEPEAAARVPFVLYNAVEDSRTRPEHLALDGKVFRKDDAAARRYFPPLGFNCRCSLIELDEEDLRAGAYGVTSGGDVPFLVTDDGELVGPPPPGWDTDRVAATVPKALTLPEAHVPPPAFDEVLARIEEDIRAKRVEHAAVIAKDGEVLVREKGTESSVPFTKAQVALMKGAVLTHNHPRGSSLSWVRWDEKGRLSGGDFGLAAYADLEEMRAVGRLIDGSDVTYRLARPEGGWPAGADVVKYSFAAEKEVLGGSWYVEALAEIEKLPEKEREKRLRSLWQDASHRVAEAIARKMGATYERVTE